MVVLFFEAVILFPFKSSCVVNRWAGGSFSNNIASIVQRPLELNFCFRQIQISPVFQRGLMKQVWLLSRAPCFIEIEELLCVYRLPITTLAPIAVDENVTHF